MKKQIFPKLTMTLCLFALLWGYAQNNESAANIHKISVQPGNVKDKIILETDSYLPLLKTYYSEEYPQTIIIEWDKVNTDKWPIFTPNELSLIQSSRIEKIGDNQLRFLIDLKEQVPYRIYSDLECTVVELNKIQRNQEKHNNDPETEKILKERGSSKIYLKKTDISEKEDRIDVIAQMTGKAVTNVFTLENPLRLVIDLFDTINISPPTIHKINKFGVKQIRAAQFRSTDHVISRLVIDLEISKFYELKSEDEKLIVSFFKEDIHQAAPQISVPPSTKADSTLNSELSQPNGEIDENKKKENEETIPQEQVTEESQKNLKEEKFKIKTITEPEKEYTGEIITLKFKDADLRDVVLFLGDFAQLNVIFDPEVSGIVTCDLVDVPWDQALDIILKINRMGRTLEGNVLRIAPSDVLAQEEERLRQLRESKELASPIQVKTITLSYAKAVKVEELLTEKLSPRGEIIIDERTNTLIISEVEDKIELLERLISVLDTATPQVSIEARIIEASSTFIRNLGIQWGFLSDTQTDIDFPSSILVDGTSLGGYAVNLPAPSFNTALGISMGNILDTFKLDMALTALESSGEGRIISCPKVTTQNNMAAEIVQGRQIPIQTTANFTVTTRFVNAALELKATPQITAEETIIMTIEIMNNAADFANEVNGIPAISTQSAKTTVMVKDGGTTVIGGIFRTEESVSKEGVPFLHKLPLLGSLFRSRSRTKKNQELLIFITPRIVK